jgi:hypothetical protein
MSVLNVNMPERDLDPEELDLEQEDAFGKSPCHFTSLVGWLTDVQIHQVVDPQPRLQPSPG